MSDMILIFKFYQIKIHPEGQTGKFPTVTVITLLQFSTEPMETLLCKCGNTVINCNWIVENFTRWAWNCGNNVTRCAWNFENAGIIYALYCGNTTKNGRKREKNCYKQWLKLWKKGHDLCPKMWRHCNKSCEMLSPVTEK